MRGASSVTEVTGLHIHLVLPMEPSVARERVANTRRMVPPNKSAKWTTELADLHRQRRRKTLVDFDFDRLREGVAGGIFGRQHIGG